ncbi:DUF4179 domain-containing protein [Bacillus wiedmannii]|uniref:DUF4179 domain-containing protein n=1 Tax=Bacillus wiedmannii TaxID=1890302 RepID=A0A2A7BVW0_9BACI|nr:DUF4179 domain-containing protein [Bacillus wiedmannii]KMP75974.1 hypothetical protein TU62_13615 [Bacillus cereus]MBG9853997.1 hypothetical protein [Bacillus wiedmannii]MCQ6542958.1 DUF4179 domain-containing protein [Bacillus wiedmannii]MCQ6570826.1 DUF4179 domain-containing protein [Bacillus wiedmannii]MCU5574774.1 DUF4179 domain-containing protein [Bacillus wiedmannii]
MSIYNELNDIQLDITEFEEIPLTKLEEKQWEKRVKNKLRKNKQSKKWFGVAAACMLMVSITAPLGQSSLANTPFIAGLIEKYLDEQQPRDYSPYKTAIGKTAENKYGKLTLNEVLVDDNKLLISSTFEPAKGVEFDYQTYLIPQVRINGRDFSSIKDAQSIEVNDSMYTIYGGVELREMPQTDELQIEITYNTFNRDTVIEQPWIFDIEVSQAQLMKEKQTFDLNETIVLSDGNKVTVKKVVSTPISTTIYYDVTQSTNEDIYFKIESESGKTYICKEAFASNKEGEISFSRFDGINVSVGKYSLVPYSGKENEVIGPSIPIQ